MKLTTATATLATIALATTGVLAAPIIPTETAAPVESDSLLRIGIDAGLLGKRAKHMQGRRDGMYHLGEGEFEHPPAPSPGLLDSLVRRQSLATPPAAKPAPGLVGSLGLAGTLAPLGLGGLLPAVESAVGGIPIVGAPVAGVVSGADDAVGVTALLSPKDDPSAAAAAANSATVSASATTSGNAKRQAGSDGLVGTLGLDGALGLLGLGGLLGTVEQTVDGLPLVGPVVGGLLGTVDHTVGLSALLGKRQSDTILPIPDSVPLSALAGVLYTLEGTGGSAAALAPTVATPLAGMATATLPSSPLSGLSLAQAEALGLLPSGFVNSLLATRIDPSA